MSLEIYDTEKKSAKCFSVSQTSGNQLEVYDCTLREGEQMAGASFNLNDRLKIVQALDEFGVDYIELGWPFSSFETMKAFHEAEKLSLNKAKIVAFGSTSISDDVFEDKNLKSIVESKAKYACIFGKTWISHIQAQLRISAEENLKKIFDSIRFLREKGVEVFYDAEHYFDGFEDNKEYALKTLEKAAEAGALRLILCDTRGGKLPEEVLETVKATKNHLESRGIQVPLGVHFHNDSGLALANTLQSLPYIKQIQATVNGFGERVGNLDLCEIVPTLALKKYLSLNIDLKKLKGISELLYDVTNLPRQMRQPYVSDRAFSHKGGVHIDAERKGASYQHIEPEALGLNSNLLFNSLGGASSVIHTAEKFGYKLDKNNKETREKINNILKELLFLEKAGYDLGDIEAEHFFIIEKHFGDLKELFSIEDWNVKTDKSGSLCELIGRVNGEVLHIEKKVSGGPVDAMYEAMKELIAKKYNIENLELIDFKVRIARQAGVESSVRTRITFSNSVKAKAFPDSSKPIKGFEDGQEFDTVGVSRNILESNFEALKKGFQYYLEQNKINLLGE